MGGNAKGKTTNLYFVDKNGGKTKVGTISKEKLNYLLKKQKQFEYMNYGVMR